MKQVRIVINPENKKSHINREIYGHFSEHLGRCIYNGIYVGEDSSIPNKGGVRRDVIDALKAIKIPVLRWPGGCFADEYHWKDGIGERSSRKKMVNTNWGHVVEDNSFGTHEFMNLCEELDCEPYVAGNLGSGTVSELAEWVEYMTFDGVSPMAELRRKNGREKPWKLKYLGIGNESWGCGGSMRPEYYADEYKRYQSFCKNFSGNELYKVACGPNADDYNWTEKLMSSLNEWQTKAISLHYYTVPTGDWSHKGDAVEFDSAEYYRTIKSTLHMDELITRHDAIMSRYDPAHKIGLIVDEWGCWYDVEKGTNPGFLYQQNTMRDAIVAAVNLNIFNEHSDRVVMANIAQTVNVLQSVILTEGEKMLLTPTYYIFKMYAPHQDAELLESYVKNDTASEGDTEIPVITKSVSMDKNGDILITLANCSIDDECSVEISTGSFLASSFTAEILTGDVHDHNSFDDPEKVRSAEFDGVKLSGNTLTAVLPKCSVIAVKLAK
jgi:alpha-N-arabinofuranosidase